MKRLIIVALAVSFVGALGLVLASDASAAPKARSPFVGDWVAVDVDGSNMQMKITGHHQPHHVKLVDDWASICPSGGPATAIGKGTLVAPLTLEVDFRVWCQIGKVKLEGSYWFDYDPLYDVLVDAFGVIWTRS